MKRMSLIQMRADRKGRVVEILAGAGLRQRLMSMGIYENKEIVKLSHIGLRGPVVIRVGRSILALGHGVAAKIAVEAE